MIKYFFIFCFQSILLVSCASAEKQRRSEIISIDIDREGHYKVNWTDVSEETLQDFLLSEIKEIEKLGYHRDEIVADISIHPDGKIGQVLNLQEALKNLHIRNIVYSDTPKEGKEQNI